MTYRINRTVAISATNGISLPVVDYVDVEAVDEISAVIEGEAGPITVNVQPGESGIVKFVQIISKTEAGVNLYEDISFTVDAEIVEIALDKAMVFMGEGQVALLGATCNDLLFTNAGLVDAHITVLVGRDAIVQGA